MRNIFATTLLLLLLSISATTNAGPGHGAPGEGLDITALPPLCESMGYISGEKCKNSPQIHNLKCDDILPPPLHWGGLRPHLAMGICINIRRVQGPYVRLTGCKAPVREQYIVLVQEGKKETPRLIKDGEEFRSFFAPIEGPKEALSYVSALTGAYPKYEFPEKYFVRDMNENGKYTTSRLKTTEVWEKKDGYHVRLFDHTRCGCMRPELFEIEYIVTRSGYIKELKKKMIWQAARLYQICID